MMLRRAVKKTIYATGRYKTDAEKVYTSMTIFVKIKYEETNNFGLTL